MTQASSTDPGSTAEDFGDRTSALAAAVNACYAIHHYDPLYTPNKITTTRLDISSTLACTIHTALILGDTGLLGYRGTTKALL